jgi:hypothetical protein
LQIWILPDKAGRSPGYEQKMFPVAENGNRLCLIAAGDGRDGALTIGQDADVFAARLQAEAQIDYSLRADRGLWLQMVAGAVRVGDQALAAGDGASIDCAGDLSLTALSDAEFLLFDLA